MLHWVIYNSYSKFIGQKFILFYFIRPSDLEADDEDTQDGDSLSHLKLDVSLTELHIDKDPSPESPTCDSVALEKARMELELLSSQLDEAKREISLLKAERDFLREQNQTLRNKK